jgi:3-hydroxyacyl-CoA dehydrogenase
MRVAILGTGKMARDLGAFYMSRGCSLVVAARDPERLASIFARAERHYRRLLEAAPREAPELPPARVLLGRDDPAEVDVVIETTAESIEAKRAMLEAAEPLLRRAGAVATNSSSLLPRQIREGIAGAHHFFPAALTGIVELIAASRMPAGAVETLRSFATGAGLGVIEETEANAFAVNRLLLPLQNEAFRALRAGVSAADVDAATRSALCPMGQLAMIDAIGIDVVAASVESYAARMSDGEAGSYAELRGGLNALLAAGKRGAKVGDGLLVGGPFPPEPRGEAESGDSLRERMHAVLLNACARAVEASELAEVDLDLALARAFGAEVRFGEALAAADGEGLGRALRDAFDAERLDYLRPAALLFR